jgi:hypothetical protein
MVEHHERHDRAAQQIDGSVAGGRGPDDDAGSVVFRIHSMNDL